MGLIKRADIEDYTRESYVMDLQDLEKRGRALIDAANTQAAQMIQQAQNERDRLVSSGEKLGFEKGYQEGIEKGIVEGREKGIQEARESQSELLNQLSEMWVSQLDAFESQRDAMIEEARTQMVQLAAMIASRVTRRVVELDPSVVMNQIEAALSSMTEPSRLVIRVHPDDAQAAQVELAKMIDRFASCEHAQVIADSKIERGSCIAQTKSGGVIDASIPTQLDRIIDAILPSNQGFDTSGETLGLSRDGETTDSHAEIEDESPPEVEPKDDAA